eukprot:CAMPEP_0202024776 /NCGR_PEP_ID=MMETSP0905-20130828/54854_1 /ASSEMBLY_ACC=CAM_ASM_000554 /TAXON_ID=420261 /ORGANISM="Thalassiosira antarctica, Strain CCMP982" /LENGTH=86 /DNA_ID=CAMNT_0048587501 /DNA_START=88 /DNA_END=345 /DNA_ORIENTATION=+
MKYQEDVLPQQTVNTPGPPMTLSPPKLLVDGTGVTGAQQQHMKRQNKRRRIEKQLSQKITSYWTTHNGTSDAYYCPPFCPPAYVSF